MAKDTLDVTFEAAIPKIEREGGTRKSKYDDLLDKVKDRAQSIKGKNKVAVLSFETQGQATSRYTSIKDAVSKREDAEEWKVAVRRGDESINLYIQWDPALAEENQNEETEDEDNQDF